MWGVIRIIQLHVRKHGAMDISFNNMKAHDASCAFPSWPRRSSLDNEGSQRPTSFFSDDELFLCDNPSRMTTTASALLALLPAHRLSNTFLLSPRSLNQILKWRGNALLCSSNTPSSSLSTRRGGDKHVDRSLVAQARRVQP